VFAMHKAITLTAQSSSLRVRERREKERERREKDKKGNVRALFCITLVFSVIS